MHRLNIALPADLVQGLQRRARLLGLTGPEFIVREIERAVGTVPSPSVPQFPIGGPGRSRRGARVGFDDA